MSLGIIEPKPDLVRKQGNRLADAEKMHADRLGWPVPVVRTPAGPRVASKGKLGNPAQIEKYLAAKFGDHLEAARAAMAGLAVVHEPANLYRRGFRTLRAVQAGGARR